MLDSKLVRPKNPPGRLASQAIGSYARRQASKARVRENRTPARFLTQQYPVGQGIQLALDFACIYRLLTLLKGANPVRHLRTDSGGLRRGGPVADSFNPSALFW